MTTSGCDAVRGQQAGQRDVDGEHRRLRDRGAAQSSSAWPPRPASAGSTKMKSRQRRPRAAGAITRSASSNVSATIGSDAREARAACSRTASPGRCRGTPPWRRARCRGRCRARAAPSTRPAGRPPAPSAPCRPCPPGRRRRRSRWRRARRPRRSASARGARPMAARPCSASTASGGRRSSSGARRPAPTTAIPPSTSAPRRAASARQDGGALRRRRGAVAVARRGRSGRRPSVAVRVSRPGTCSSSTTWKLVPPKPNALTPAPPDAGRRRRPVAQLGVDVRTASAAKSMFGFGRSKLQAGRQHLVVQRQRRLEHAGRAGRALEMADVRLHRAERDRAGRQPRAARRPRPCSRPRRRRRRGSRCRGPRSACTSRATARRFARRARRPASGRPGWAR